MQDEYKAVTWFEKAAEADLHQAQVCQADMLANAEGISTDYHRAEALCRKVIESRDKVYSDGALISSAILQHDKDERLQSCIPLMERIGRAGQ